MQGTSFFRVFRRIKIEKVVWKANKRTKKKKTTTKNKKKQTNKKKNKKKNAQRKFCEVYFF